jgi:hypothetical protein
VNTFRSSSAAAIVSTIGRLLTINSRAITSHASGLAVIPKNWRILVASPSSFSQQSAPTST